MPKSVKFFGLIFLTLVTLYLCKLPPVKLSFSPRQILSIGIFSMFIYGTLLYSEFRLAFAFGGIALLMACNLLTVQRFTQSASLDVLVFLIGTFLVIGFLEESQFFEHIVSQILAAVGPRPTRLILALMLMASISSALVGEVTAILFMAGAMLHLTSRYKLNPVPFIIMLVFACNIGSAMSSVGNPIGVLIALKTGLSFMDFVKWAAPVAIVVDVVTFLICRWYFAADFAAFGAAVRREFEVVSDDYHDREAVETIHDLDVPQTYRLCWMILLLLIALLVTHRITEHLLGLREGTMMVAAALIMGSIVLLIRREKARELVERRVDWWTLSFFMMLFASVGTLEDTGVTKVIALKLSGMSQSNHTLVIQVVGWGTGWLSAFLDNVLAVATFMPVVHDIRVAAPGKYESSIYWLMLFGGTFMGNMTIIGSTANIVAVGLLEKRGHGTIRFGYWMKIGFIVSIASMLVASAMLEGISRVVGMPMLEKPVVEVVRE